MHPEILSTEQRELLPLLQHFSEDFYLVGGTAIALHIGHQRSIDFDLFTRKQLNRAYLKSALATTGFPVQHILYEDTEQLHLVINSVKFTFFHYSYSIPADIHFEGIITLPSLLDLAAMKAFALGQRGKWKDYVDLYFLLKRRYSLATISQRARSLFQNGFNPKLFRQQLCYFEDVDFSEAVDYVTDSVSNEAIQTYLIDVATSPF